MAQPTVLLAVVLLSTLATMAVAGVKEEVRVEITSAQPGNVKVTTSYQYDAQVCDAAAPILTFACAFVLLCQLCCAAFV
jgi:hypothetical protein